MRDCLDSCLEQNFPISEFEIICIDDASTDDSLTILREYESDNTNVRVFSLPENSGASSARNVGLEHCVGDRCIFLDCDDFLADNCLSKARELLKDDGDSVLCVGMTNFKNQHCDRRDCAKNGSYLGCANRYITNRFIPTRYAKQVRFNEHVQYGEDELFGLEIRVLFGPNVINLDEPMYFYRIHKNQTMALNTVDKRIKRLNSVMYSAVYVRKKYGLQDLYILRFFKERISIAFEEIDRLRFYRRFFYLIRMKCHDLIVFRKNDVKGRGKFFRIFEKKA